jgi:hypothetical protein
MAAMNKRLLIFESHGNLNRCTPCRGKPDQHDMYASHASHHAQRSGGGERFGQQGDKMLVARHPGSITSASGKEEGNAAHRASGATTTTERGRCGGVLRQRRHIGGQRRASAGLVDGGGGGG